MTQRSIVVLEPDPWLAVTVESLLAKVQPAPDLAAVADVEELLEWADPTSIVIAGPSWSTKAGVEELRAFRDDFPAARLVLAFEKRPGAATKDVVALAADALVDPRNTAELREAIQVTMARADAVRETMLGWDPDADSPLGKVFTVCSATGGSGKTFYATNIAFALSRYTTGRVALVDLDLQFGEVMTALRLRARNTMADAIAIEDDEELVSYLPELMAPHESGVFVLPAPTDPAQADQITPSDVLRVIKALKEHYDYVIVDTPTGLAEQVLVALDQSTHLFVLAALDLSSVRNVRLFLQTLERLQIPSDDVSLILNKDQKGVGIDAEQVEKLFDGGFRMRIPFSRDVPRSMNTGTPILMTEPDSEVSHRIAFSLSEFLDAESQARVAAAHDRRKPASWWQNLLRRGQEERRAPQEPMEVQL